LPTLSSFIARTTWLFSAFNLRLAETSLGDYFSSTCSNEAFTDFTPVNGFPKLSRILIFNCWFLAPIPILASPSRSAFGRSINTCNPLNAESN